VWGVLYVGLWGRGRAECWQAEGAKMAKGFVLLLENGGHWPPPQNGRIIFQVGLGRQAVHRLGKSSGLAIARRAGGRHSLPLSAWSCGEAVRE